MFINQASDSKERERAKNLMYGMCKADTSKAVQGEMVHFGI